MAYWVGTSGFSYDSWRGDFYPEDVPKRRWLEYYATKFRTVEINSSFYHLPRVEVLEGWQRRAPEGFLFAMKAWRVITHRKRLRDVEEELEVMANRLEHLGDRLGPVLFQFPPNFKMDMDRLEGLLRWVDSRRWDVALEFRHESWYEERVYEKLRDTGVAWVVFHSPTIQSPRQVTASFAYFRFHGTERWFAGTYQEQLPDWAEFMGSLDVSNIFAYFNNDMDGSGHRDAGLLLGLLTRSGGPESDRVGGGS